MSIYAAAFLKSVLGEDGATALKKANDRVPTLGAVLTPRTIISWLTTAVRINYEGEIPGVSNSYMSLQKSDRGFTGAITIGDAIQPFEDSDLLHVAASIGVALGLADTQIHPAVKHTDISKLGKSIDLLVKARVLAKTVGEDLAKMGEDSHNYWHITDDPHFKINSEPRFEYPYDSGKHVPMLFLTTTPAKWRSWVDTGKEGARLYAARIAPSPKVAPGDTGLPEHMDWDPSNAQVHEFLPVEEAIKKYPKDFADWDSYGTPTKKQELPGGAAAPKKPKEPEAPQVPVARAPSTNKVSKPPMAKKELSIRKSAAHGNCPECGLKNFRGDNFVGCMCWRALAKSVVTKASGDSYVLTLGRADWDDESIQTLLSTFGG